MVRAIAGRWVRSGFHSGINGVVKSYGFYALGYELARCFLSEKGIIHIEGELEKGFFRPPGL